MWHPKLDANGSAKHRMVLAALRADLEAGRLREGERLPPARALADALGLAVGTVARAYHEAAAEGLVRSEVGRGTHVTARPVRPDMTFGRRVEGLIDLGVDYPLEAFDPDPGPVLARLAGRADRAALMRYHAHEGSPRARAAGAAWAERYGVADGRAAEDVVLCGGGQHALVVALACVAAERRATGMRGGTVLAEALAYPGLRPAAGLLGLDLAPVAIDGDGLVPEALEEACRRHPDAMALYLVPSLHNPTTAALPAARRAAVAETAARHGLFLVEDDVHRLHADNPASPLAVIAPERTFFVAGLSKTVAAGLRVAYLLPPRALVNAAARGVLATHWTLPPLTAEIAAQWVEDGTADAVCAAKAAEAAARQVMASKALPRGAARTQRQSFYVWLDLPAGWTGESFALAAARRGVGLLGDAAFRVGDGPTTPGVRVCLGAAPDRETLEHALGVVAALLGQPPDVFPGVV